MYMNIFIGDNEEDLGKPQVQLGFNCFMIDMKTGNHVVVGSNVLTWYQLLSVSYFVLLILNQI